MSRDPVTLASLAARAETRAEVAAGLGREHEAAAYRREAAAYRAAIVRLMLDDAPAAAE